ncbi:MAG: GNAT family N-acetyltransferase [Allomuricauda sp.]|nr:MAG: GNAT family N-acetyltransferase [Allomuricauda sp.]
MTQCEQVRLRKAQANDLGICMEIRGKTKDNPIDAQRLREFGVTQEGWRALMEVGEIIGSVIECDERVVGYCFANSHTGEILVLAVHADFDGQGFGKASLTHCLNQMKDMGFKKVWLAASPNPLLRAYGFYRHLGWQPTGRHDAHEDEILEFEFP